MKSGRKSRRSKPEKRALPARRTEARSFLRRPVFRYLPRTLLFERWAFSLLLLAAIAFGAWAGRLAFLRSPEAPHQAAVRKSEPQEEAFSHYAGSSTCRECHASEFQQWEDSNHGMAERAVSSIEQPAFHPARTFQHGTQSTDIRTSGTEFQIVTTGLDGQRRPWVAERVIGHFPLRQFLVKAPGGRLQTMEASYDPAKNEWFNVFGSEDRKPGEWGHWSGRGMTWNTMCAACHNTRLRKNYDEKTDSYATAAPEMSVGCEACHGPMKQHVAWQKNPDHAGTDPTLLRMTRPQWVDTCGTCHSRRVELTGDFIPGESFFDHFSLETVDQSDHYYPDGQVRDEDYEYASFLSSTMHTAGVTCLDCHNPHSGKTILEGDALCMRCHSTGLLSSPRIVPEMHTFHKPESTGSRCVNCHMPQTTYMQRHPRHDHGFTSPDPLLTEELGIPNACNRCHTDQTTGWSITAVNAWYGSRMERPARARARVVAAARNGNTTAAAVLVRLAESEKSYYWKGVYASLMAPFASDPSVASALGNLVVHKHPLVRERAVTALDGLFQEPRTRETWSTASVLLSDASRNVRITAAWIMRSDRHQAGLAIDELASYLDINADQPGGQMQKGLYHLSRQEMDRSLSHLKKAVEWDPHSPVSRVNYAIALSLAGRSDDAVKHLTEACRISPNDSDIWYQLGLAWNEAGNTAETINALEKAVETNPRHSRAWYNLGLARNMAGHAESAIEALATAEGVDPSDPDIPYAAATILQALGRLDEARAAAARAGANRHEF